MELFYRFWPWTKKTPLTIFALFCFTFDLVVVASSSSHDPYLMRREGVLQEIRHYYRIFVPWSSTGWLPWQVGARFVIYDFWLEYHCRVTLSPPGGNAVHSFVYVTKRQQQWQLLRLNQPPTTQINTTQQSSHAHREWWESESAKGNSLSEAGKGREEETSKSWERARVREYESARVGTGG